MKVFSTTQARERLSELVNQVKYKKEIIGIGRHNKCEVLLIPLPDLSNDDTEVTSINEASPSFDFLEDEPDLYSFDDLKKPYV